MTTPGTSAICEPARRSRRPVLRAEPLFYLAAVFVFLDQQSQTIWFCSSMSGGMEMPGHWTMSMMWMPMRANLGCRVGDVPAHVARDDGGP